MIVNPCAGKNRSRADVSKIVSYFPKEEYDLVVRTTTCCGDATNIVKSESEGKDFVVCCGGDGTLNETINGVMDMPKRIPIGYIPTGTTCDLASTLGVPSDVSAAIDIIKKGYTNDYDIGLFNNRYFSYVASFGAFCKSSYATPQKLKNRFGHAAYIVEALREIKDIHGTYLRVEHDGGVIEGKFCFGSISNSTSVAGIFKFDPEQIKLNDGIFEVHLVRDLKGREIVPTFFQVKRQDYDGKRVFFLKTSKLKITSPYEELEWTLDGEYGGKHNEVMVHVLERAVRIYSPENPLFLKRPEIIPEVIEKETPEAKKEKRRGIKRGGDETAEPTEEKKDRRRSAKRNENESAEAEAVPADPVLSEESSVEEKTLEPPAEEKQPKIKKPKKRSAPNKTPETEEKPQAAEEEPVTAQ